MATSGSERTADRGSEPAAEQAPDRVGRGARLTGIRGTRGWLSAALAVPSMFVAGYLLATVVTGGGGQGDAPSVRILAPKPAAISPLSALATIPALPTKPKRKGQAVVNPVSAVPPVGRVVNPIVAQPTPTPTVVPKPKPKPAPDDTITIVSGQDG